MDPAHESSGASPESFLTAMAKGGMHAVDAQEAEARVLLEAVVAGDDDDSDSASSTGGSLFRAGTFVKQRRASDAREDNGSESNSRSENRDRESSGDSSVAEQMRRARGRSLRGENSDSGSVQGLGQAGAFVPGPNPDLDPNRGTATPDKTSRSGSWSSMRRRASDGNSEGGSVGARDTSSPGTKELVKRGNQYGAYSGPSPVGPPGPGQDATSSAGPNGQWGTSVGNLPAGAASASRGTATMSGEVAGTINTANRRSRPWQSAARSGGSTLVGVNVGTATEDQEPTMDRSKPFTPGVALHGAGEPFPSRGPGNSTDPVVATGGIVAGPVAPVAAGSSSSSGGPRHTTGSRTATGSSFVGPLHPPPSTKKLHRDAAQSANAVAANLRKQRVGSALTFP